MDIDKIDLVVHLNVRNPKAFVNQKYLQVEVRTAFACNIVVQTFVAVVDTFDAVGTFVAVGMSTGPSLTVIVLMVVEVKLLCNPFARLGVVVVQNLVLSISVILLLLALVVRI